MSYIVVFDDTLPKSELIEDVIGRKGFGDVVVKKQTLGARFAENMSEILEEKISPRFLRSIYEIDGLIAGLEASGDTDSRVIHFFSNYVFSDVKAAGLTVKKADYVDEPLVVKCGSGTSEGGMSQKISGNGDMAGKIVMVQFESVDSYVGYLSKVSATENKNTLTATNDFSMFTEIDGMMDIGNIESFLQCVAGNFEARFFNSLAGDEFTLVKSSTKKDKIKAEYTFYHLLPEDMQMWFVEPFDYQEDNGKASYTMERLHMTDLAIKWVHGSIDEDEFERILDKYFYFFNNRHDKEIPEDEYKAIEKSLYEDKVVKRVEELKILPEYAEIAKLLSMNDGLTIDDVVRKYLGLKEKMSGVICGDYVSVIGHGDPCFANTMYNKSTRTLKFIDPKGALTEEELYTNPYYDIAKLSHSVCGRYDFFNNGLFEINVDTKLGTELSLDFDNSVYIDIFRRKLEENGFDYWLVRLYEASLFISMLPLHIDYPQKVLGFILNANNILKEIEQNV